MSDRERKGRNRCARLHLRLRRPGRSGGSSGPPWTTPANDARSNSVSAPTTLHPSLVRMFVIIGTSSTAICSANKRSKIRCQWDSAGRLWCADAGGTVTMLSHPWRASPLVVCPSKHASISPGLMPVFCVSNHRRRSSIPSPFRSIKVALRRRAELATGAPPAQT